MDVIGRTIPTELRGRFFAFSSAAGAAGGLLGGFLTSAILDWTPGPGGYGICFLIAAVFTALSYLALGAVREPLVVTTAAPTTLATYLRRVPAFLRRDPAFAWFLAVRALAIVGATATAFYAVHGLRAYGATDRWVGVFTALLFSGQVVGTVTFGWLADRLGHRLVIVLGVTATAAANVLALLAPGLHVFSAVFALSGLQQAAATVSNLNVLMEFAPAAGERPTYVGLGNTLVAPVAFVAPLAAGAAADAWGFHAVFLAAIAFGLLALALLVARVRDPRLRDPASGAAGSESASRPGARPRPPGRPVADP
jgi:MFS family permease